MTALSDVSTHAMASARRRISEVAFWVLALACAFLFPSRYLIMTDIVRLGLFANSMYWQVNIRRPRLSSSFTSAAWHGYLPCTSLKKGLSVARIHGSTNAASSADR